MKKRFSALFAAAVLCVSLLIPAFSAGAAETPHFLAVNENLLPLEDRYITIIADGMYYVPYHALDVSSTGIDLGIYPVYNTAIRTLTIYNREKVIAFDLAGGTCTDRDGTVYSARAVTRNGQVYVPAKFICDYFDLSYTYFPETKFGPMVRIYSSSSRLSDEHFLAAAQMMMEDRLNDWRKNQTPVVTPVPSNTTGVRPSVSPSPAIPEKDKSDVRTYLAFRVDQTDGLGSLLARLEDNQIRGLFFFPADKLAEHDEDVRSVLCGGHAVGLMLSGETAEELLAQAQEGNLLLRQIAYCESFTVLLPEGIGRETEKEIENSGFLIWKTDVDALPNGESVSARSTAVMNAVDTYDERVYILSDCSSSASALMAWLISDLNEDRYQFRLAVETEI